MACLFSFDDDPECLALFREAMVEKPGKRAKSDTLISDNVTNKTSDERGNSKAYSIDRVKRECKPEVVFFRRRTLVIDYRYSVR
jgi:hypothetical protein